MSAGRDHIGRRAGRRRPLAAAALVLALASAAVGLGPPVAAQTAGNDDALQARVRAELAVFTGWLQRNGVNGYIGEVGWPNDADTASWNALAGKWYADAATAGLWTTAWSAGEWWGCGYKLSVYVWSTCSTMDGSLSVARSPAAVIEALAGADRRGVNMSGGDFGTPGPLEATSSFSNQHPGTYNAAYHYDTPQSFRYVASRGISLVRLPVRWERVQPVLGGPLDAAEVQRIADAVAAASAGGMRVILDIHNYGAYWLSDGSSGVRRAIGSAEVTVTHFATLWRLLSNSFRANPGVAGYGLMNEPVGMAGAAVWEQASQAAVTAIRQAGDGKLVLVPGYNWAGAQQWTSQHPRAWIGDANVRYEAHHYWDGDNSGAYLTSYANELASAAARGYVASAPTATTAPPPPPPTTAAPPPPPTTATTTPPPPTTTTTSPPPPTTTTTTVAGPTADTTAPAAPQSLYAFPTGGRVFLTWRPSTDQGGSGLAGYEVFRAPTWAGPWTNIATVIGTTAVDSFVAPPASYAYYVRAYDRAGNRSAPSALTVVYVT